MAEMLGQPKSLEQSVQIPIASSIPIFAPATAAPGGADPLHELRVRIPVDLHRQLLSLKVLRGKSLAETVSTALDIYFLEHSKRASEANDS
jgi:hypothetical protein